MFRNYLAAALRNLMRNKLVSVINIAGLRRSASPRRCSSGSTCAIELYLR